MGNQPNGADSQASCKRRAVIAHVPAALAANGPVLWRIGVLPLFHRDSPAYRTELRCTVWYSSSMEPPRSPHQRKADALALLTARHADLWMASASASGVAHLVPLSFAWDGEHVILATALHAVTTRNISATRRARLALGGTRDVVMIDALLVRQVALREIEAALAERYAAQADWDPRSADGDFIYSLVHPDRIQVWREVNEHVGRTVMRGGVWLV